MQNFVIFGVVGFIISLLIYFLFFREEDTPSLNSIAFLSLMITASQIIVSLATGEVTWAVVLTCIIGCAIFMLPLAYFYHLTDVFSNVIGYFWTYYSLKNILTSLGVTDIQGVLVELNKNNMDGLIPNLTDESKKEILLLLNRKSSIGELVWLLYSSALILSAETYASAII